MPTKRKTYDPSYPDRLNYPICNFMTAEVIYGENSKGEPGMASFLTNGLERYLPRHAIPLYVEEVAVGAHPARRFHGHTFMEIVLILAGEGEHLVGESSTEIRAGDVLLIHPGISHGYDRTATLGLVNLVYDPHKLALPQLDGQRMPLFDRLFMPWQTITPELIGRPLLHLETAETAALGGKINRLATELNSNRPGRNFLSTAIFMEIVAELCRSGTASEEPAVSEFLIGDAIRYMHDHLDEPIEVEKLPDVVSMSRRNFFRRFRNATGCTPGEYLRELRFHHALELLRRTDLSVAEVALRSGFCDGNYICRLFRERLDTTPRRFRAACRTDNPGH